MSELGNPILTLAAARKRRALAACDPHIEGLICALQRVPHPSSNELKALVGRLRVPVRAHLTAGVVDGLARRGYDNECIARCRADIESIVDEAFLTDLIVTALEDIDSGTGPGSCA